MASPGPSKGKTRAKMTQKGLAGRGPLLPAQAACPAAGAVPAGAGPERAATLPGRRAPAAAGAAEADGAEHLQPDPETPAGEPEVRPPLPRPRTFPDLGTL